MAFLSAPLRWSVALPIDSAFDSIASSIRPFLPSPLATLPSPLVAAIFLSWTLLLSVLAFSFFLNQRRRSLVAAQPHTATAASSRRRKPGQPLTTLLIGPEQTGKSSIYSALVFDALPETHTSQHENQSRVSLRGTEKQASRTQVHLVDLPGHPRLRGKANDFLAKADRIVFCVDAASAIKGGTNKNESLIEAVDHFHATLTSLARSRLSRSSSSSSSSRSSAAPALLVLFTRGDLSPLLSASPFDHKRQAQVITRARAAFEAELGRRRAGMGLGRGAAGQVRAKVGGMGKVVGGGGTGLSKGWLSSLKALLGFGSTTGGSAGGKEEDEEEEDEDQEMLDYVDWSWSQRVGGSAGGTSSSSSTTTTFTLDKLDQDVILGGKPSFLVSSLGKERGWDVQGRTTAVPSNRDEEVDQSGLEEEKEGDDKEEEEEDGDHFEGLKGLKAWLRDADSDL